MLRLFPILLLVFLLVCTAACTSKQENSSVMSGAASSEAELPASEGASLGEVSDLDDYEDYTAEDAAMQDDPLEGWNRFWFHVNDWFIQYILKPVHKGYTFIVPEKIRSGISTFAYNIAFPIRMTNSLLQGEFAQAGVEFDRSLVNFMVSFGFADVASQSRPLFPYRPETENFDHTLGVWGVPDGPYFIIPFLGPSTVRGAFGEAGDTAMKPQNYIFDWPVTVSSGLFLAFNSADELYKPYDQITGSALEPYVALRNGYLNLRKKRQASLLPFSHQD